MSSNMVGLRLKIKKSSYFSTESQKDISIPAHLHELSILEEFACGCGSSKENSCFLSPLCLIPRNAPRDTCGYVCIFGEGGERVVVFDIAKTRV